MPAFRLSKWYMDAVDLQGRAVIVYWAHLRYGPVSLSYSAVLDARGPQPTTRTSWRPCHPPALCGDRVFWKHEALGIDAEWRLPPQPMGLARTLFSGPLGDVRWNLIAPVSMLSGTVAGSSFVGCGYIEHLEMTLPPWRLPIDELRWGRAHAAGETAVRIITWIDWRGPHPLTLVLGNQGELDGAQVSDTGVSGGGFRVDLAPAAAPGSRVLREGPLVTSALRGAPGLSKWAPASILAAHETKHLCRCVIHDPDHGDLHGWSIHEVVRFRNGEPA